jgi:hypothetical protein
MIPPSVVLNDVSPAPPGRGFAWRTTVFETSGQCWWSRGGK